MDSTPTIFLTGATGQLGSFLLAEFLGFGSLYSLYRAGHMPG